MNIFSYFILFMIYSFLGWIIEVCVVYYAKGKFINRGFLIGPYCPIYGIGALLVTFLLQDYVSMPVGLFIMSVVICALLEYTGSYLLEKIFNTRWWDYSNKKFNINGRICLENLIPFGIGCLIIIYYLNPYFISFLTNLNKTLIIIIAVILLIIIIIDFCVSFEIIWKFKNFARNTRKDNTEKVTQYVKKEVLNKNKKLYVRIIEAFPKFEVSTILKRKDKRKKDKK